MHSAFDLISMGAFCALAIFFLQRSSAPRVTDRVISYVPPAAGCVGFDLLGNSGHVVAALVVAALAIGYGAVMLRGGGPRG